MRCTSPFFSPVVNATWTQQIGKAKWEGGICPKCVLDHLTQRSKDYRTPTSSNIQIETPETLEKSACAGDTEEIWISLSFTSCVNRLCFCSLVHAASRPLLLDLCCRCTLRALRCETCCRKHLSIICEMVFFVVRFRFRNFVPSISLIALFCSCLSSVHCLPAGP